MNLISIPAFQDNYIWLLANRQNTVLSLTLVSQRQF